MILFVNTCIRENSRTRWLASEVLARIKSNDEIIEIIPNNSPLTNEQISQLDSRNFAAAIFNYARTFARASQVVIAAPYWDLSFPASLKNYIEAINVVGITFAYTPEGQPYGMCNARKLYYVTTAGGFITSDAFGYGYVNELARGYWGIPETFCVKAEGLDIIGADVRGILDEALQNFTGGKY